MNYDFKTTNEFAKQLKRLAKKYPSIKSDFKSFINSFIENPSQGIDLGGGFRKIRFSISSKGKGKSGGGRFITHEAIINTSKTLVVFVAVYDKSEVSTINIGLLKRNLGLK